MGAAANVNSRISIGSSGDLWVSLGSRLRIVASPHSEVLLLRGLPLAEAFLQHSPYRSFWILGIFRLGDASLFNNSNTISVLLQLQLSVRARPRETNFVFKCCAEGMYVTLLVTARSHWPTPAGLLTLYLKNMNMQVYERTRR